MAPNCTPAEAQRRAASPGAYLHKLGAADLLSLAHKLDFERIRRAVWEFSAYRLLPDGALVHRTDGTIYHCDEVRTWPELPGTVVFVGCDCPDQAYRMTALHKALAAAGAGARCACKHQYMRQLLAGHTLRVPLAAGPPSPEARWVAVTARPLVLK